MKFKLVYELVIDTPENHMGGVYFVLDKKRLKRTLSDFNEKIIYGEDFTYDSKLEAMFMDNRISVREDNYPF